MKNGNGNRNENGIKLNVICVQINPITKKIDENIQKAQKLLDEYDKNDNIDIIVFPEMAFTGYIFKDKNDIESCLEEKGNGRTFDFCRKLALRYF
jgi:protein N-terminal amidase